MSLINIVLIDIYLSINLNNLLSESFFATYNPAIKPLYKIF